MRNTRVDPVEHSDYALVPKGAPLPELPPGTAVLRTPVQRIVILETVHAGYLAAIDELDRIVGAGSTQSPPQCDHS